MFTAALIGPDGAGKTTIARRLESALPLPVKYVYMGINLGSSNIMLPTSRLILVLREASSRRADRTGKPCAASAGRGSGGLLRRAMTGVRSSLRLANLLAEETFRYALVWCYRRRGYIVIFDRWFLADYLTSQTVLGKRQSITTRIHSFMLTRVYPKPDLVIYLDAPAEVLFARKREGTLELREYQRQAHLKLAQMVQRFTVVDAGQPENEVMQAVALLISDFYKMSLSLISNPEKRNRRSRIL